MPKAPIKDRIIAALREHGELGQMNYHRLAICVFPRKDFPKAWNYPTRGGPPGCYMALSRAIDRHGFNLRFDSIGGVSHSTVTLGKNRKS